jgi:NADPH2:quinone reductase
VCSSSSASPVRGTSSASADAAVDAAVLGVGTMDGVRNGGRLAYLVGGPAPGDLRGITVRVVYVDAGTGRLADIAALVETGVLTPRVAGTYALAEAATAYARLAKGGVRGRLVLTP